MSDVVNSLSIIIPTYFEKLNLPYLISMIIEELAKVLALMRICNLFLQNLDSRRGYPGRQHSNESFFIIQAHHFPFIFSFSDVEYELLIVEDGSMDGTLEVFRRMCELFPGVDMHILERPSKLGLGTAYVDGLKHTKYDFILIMDADLSHQPKYIPEMIRLQRRCNYDIVTGTRYAPGGGASGWDWKRIFISKTANFLAQFLLETKLTDLTGSFRLYRRTLFKKIIGSIQSKGYIFQMEIIVRAEKQMNARIAELPIIFIERIYGESKLDANEIISYLTGLFKLALEL